MALTELDEALFSAAVGDVSGRDLAVDDLLDNDVITCFALFLCDKVWLADDSCLDMVLVICFDDDFTPLAFDDDFTLLVFDDDFTPLAFDDDFTLLVFDDDLLPSDDVLSAADIFLEIC